MGIWERVQRNFGYKNNADEHRAYDGGSDFSSLFEVQDVTEKTVLTIPTASDCVEKISGSIAQLPIYLYREDKVTGEVEKISDDHRMFLLNNEPNEHLSAYDFKKQMVKDYLLHGHSHTYIEKSGLEVEALYPLPVENIEVKKLIKSKGFNYTSQVVYKIDHEDADMTIEQVFKPIELLSVLRNTKDGVRGIGILSQGKQTFELALNENDYTANILNRGALPLGILETDGRLTEPTAKRLRKSWESIYGGAKNSGKTVILEEGLKYKPLSLSPKDLGLQEGRKISSEEICKLFTVPPSLILGEKGYGDSEQDNLHFLKYCLAPILSCIEHQLDRSLLLEDEKLDGYYFRFDITEMLRTTEKEMYESIQLGMNNGVLSINEARGKVDLPPLDKDFIMMNLGNIFYDKTTGEFVVPNTGQNIENSNSGDVEENDDKIEKEDFAEVEETVEETSEETIEEE